MGVGKGGGMWIIRYLETLPPLKLQALVNARQKRRSARLLCLLFFALPTTTITQPLLLEIPRPRVIFPCFRWGKPFFSCLHDFKFLSSYCDFRVCAHYTDFNRASPESILNGKGSDENPSILPNLEEEEDSRSQP